MARLACLDRVVGSRLVRNVDLPQFDGLRRCALPPSAFLARMLRYGHASPCCLVIAMSYLERVNERLPSVCLTAFNMQRLLLTLVMLASKCFDDYFCSNKQWAMIGDLQTRELNRLELDILHLLEFKLVIDRETYERVKAQLEEIDMKTFRSQLSAAESPNLAPAAKVSPPSACGATAQETAAAIRTAVQVAAQKAAHGIFAEHPPQAAATGDSGQAEAEAADAIPKGPSPRRDEETTIQQPERETKCENGTNGKEPATSGNEPARNDPGSQYHHAESTGRVTTRVIRTAEKLRHYETDIEVSSPVKLATFASASSTFSAKAVGVHIPMTAAASAKKALDRTPAEESPDEYYDIPIPVPTDHESTSTQAEDMKFDKPEKSPSASKAPGSARSQYMRSLVNREARQQEPEEGVQLLKINRSQSAVTGVQEATPRQPHPRMAHVMNAPYHVATPRRTSSDVNIRQSSPSWREYSPRVFTPRSSEYQPPYAARSNTPTRMVDNTNYAVHPITPRVPHHAAPTNTGEVRPRTPVTGHRPHSGRPMSQPQVAHNRQAHWRPPAVPPAYDANVGAYREQWAGSSSDAFQHANGQQRAHATPFAPPGGSLDTSISGARMVHVASGSPATLRAAQLVYRYWHQGSA